VKLSPILDGFIDYLNGSPVSQQTGGAKFFRYDSATVFADVDAQLVPSVKGFAYVVQVDSATNDNAGNVNLAPVTISATVFCVHSGSETPVFNPLEITEILTDLHGGSFTASTGEDILVLLSGNFLQLLSIEPFPIHAVTFELKRL